MMAIGIVVVALAVVLAWLSDDWWRAETNSWYWNIGYFVHYRLCPVIFVIGTLFVAASIVKWAWKAMP